LAGEFGRFVNPAADARRDKADAPSNPTFGAKVVIGKSIARIWHPWIGMFCKHATRIATGQAPGGAQSMMDTVLVRIASMMLHCSRLLGLATKCRSRTRLRENPCPNRPMSSSDCHSSNQCRE
jgi:hypothetical protein